MHETGGSQVSILIVCLKKLIEIHFFYPLGQYMYFGATITFLYNNNNNNNNNLFIYSALFNMLGDQKRMPREEVSMFQVKPSHNSHVVNCKIPYRVFDRGCRATSRWSAIQTSPRRSHILVSFMGY